MKNTIYIIAILAFLGFPTISWSQNALTVDVTHATNQPGQCEDGAIDLMINGGFPPYDVYWVGPSGFSSSVSSVQGTNDGEDIENLRPGEYTVTVYDALCGEVSLTEEVFCCQSLDAEVTNPTMPDCNNGSIDLMINGGQAPYTVQWNARIGTFFWVNVSFQTGLPGNNGQEDLSGYSNLFSRYQVRVTDANGCEVRMDFIPDCVCDDCEVAADVIQPNCLGPGSIRNTRLECSNGDSRGLSFVWEDGSTSGTRTGLETGEYCVTVTLDGNEDCSYERCYSLEGPSTFRAKVIGLQNVGLCEGEGSTCNGSIDLDIVSGTTTGLTYEWSNGASTQDISGLCPGVYTVTITNRDGCTKTVRQEICCCAEFEQIGGDRELVAGDCYPGDEYIPELLNISGQANSQNGSISVNITGGTTNKVCVWSGPNGYSNFFCGSISGLEPGEYCLTVDDGCEETEECWTIVDCDSQNLNISGNVTNACTGFCEGAVSINVSGGNSPYTYSWSNGSQGPAISNLCQGQYCVTVTDVAGCEETTCFTVGLNQLDIVDSFCQRTSFCNGQIVDVETFPVQEFLNCNILTVCCSLTGQCEDFNLGFVDVFIRNCAIIGLCQDGTERVLEQGITQFGAFTTEDPRCPVGIACVDRICCFSGGCIIPDDANIVCSSAWFQPNANCPEGTCFVQVFCGTTEVASGCVQDISCGLRSPNIDMTLAEQLGIPKHIWTKQDLLDYANSRYSDEISESTERIESREIASNFNAVIYPNPFIDDITIKFENTDSEKLDIQLFNVLGEEVFDDSYNIQVGTNEIKVNLSPYTAGIYFVKLSFDGITLDTQRIVKNN